MADSEEEEDEITKHTLFTQLKSTVEGLLANQSVNVWNTYGGLSRLCQDVESILQHKLLQNQVNCTDYWEFVRALRCLSPVLAPSIEKINRLSDPSGRSRRGQVWLRQCLLNHDLAYQLKTLVDSEQHLHTFYSADAFLCNKEYFQAMFICLEAVEQNRPALLAEISPKLLRRNRPSHTRSASLPLNTMRKLSEHPCAPMLAISPTPSEITTSGEQARPSSGSSPGTEGRQSAKEALLSVLAKSDSRINSNGSDDYPMYTTFNSDPLMNMEFSSTRASDFLALHKSSSRSTSRRRSRKSSHPEHRKKQSRPPTIHKSNSTPTLQRQASELSGVLDNILNNEESEGDVFINEEKANAPPEEIQWHRSSSSVLTSQSRTYRKVLHARSRSDMTTGQTAGQANFSDTALKSTNMFGTSCPGESSFRQRSTRDEGDGRLYSGSEGLFPRPAQGQSLISFLSQQDFNTCAELDKENAHFSICEALIAATELMKWNQVLRPPVVYDEDEESDDEIRELKQRIRLRRREKMKEQAKNFPALSDGRTDTNTTSTSPFSSVHESSAFSDDASESSSVDENTIEIEVSQQGTESNLSALQDTGLSLSMGSMYSETEIKKHNATIVRQSSLTDSNMMSAEAVAIALLKKFHAKHLPKASELEWLVSEEEAPQTLLPLPNSYPISPDDSENFDIGKRHTTRLRGNMEWAPPRAQIIFNIIPSQKRTAVMMRQNYRCAGCGTKVEPGFAKRFRYCEYLGKYFCQCCHGNATSSIPARILQKWDFTRCHVSNFSRDLLERMHSEPLFNLLDINASLYRRVKVLDQVKDCRIQLYHLRTFLRTCRNGQSMLSELDRFPTHIYTEPHVYSLANFEEVKNNTLLPRLKSMVGDCITHVKQCQLCQARGFFCELCNRDDVIYPWQLSMVSQCPVCRSCYHKSCYVPDRCPKCARIEARRQSMVRTSSPDDSR